MTEKSMARESKLRTWNMSALRTNPPLSCARSPSKKIYVYIQYSRPIRLYHITHHSFLACRCGRPRLFKSNTQPWRKKRITPLRAPMPAPLPPSPWRPDRSRKEGKTTSARCPSFIPVQVLRLKHCNRTWLGAQCSWGGNCQQLAPHFFT